MYKQTDYPGLMLGNSGLNVGQFGCVAIDVVNALNLAGYSVTPEEFVTAMNEKNGFNDQGLLVWGVVSELYPQFRFGGEGYTFAQGTWGRFNHWVLEHNGVTYDPWYGVENAPSGWVANGVTRTAAIDPNTPPAPEFPRTATVTTEAHVRMEPTTASAPVPQPTASGLLEVGNTFEAVGVVEGQSVTELVGGKEVSSTEWVKSSLDHYVWRPLTNI